MILNKRERKLGKNRHTKRKRDRRSGIGNFRALPTA